MAEVDVFAVEFVFGGAFVTAADHGFAGAELAARNQAHGSAARAGHDRYVRILRVAELGLIL